jgi:DNA-directed RNA polymerase specialized sigma24 family protein
LRLPKLQRECVYLKSRGLRYHEIAATLDISMTVAVDCVRQAVKRLKTRVEAQTEPTRARKRS